MIFCQIHKIIDKKKRRYFEYWYIKYNKWLNKVTKKEIIYENKALNEILFRGAYWWPVLAGCH